MPTQLNGRTIVYGSSYCSQAPFAKYSAASFWKPYVETGGGEVSWAPSGVGNTVADSKTIERAHDDDPLELAALVGRDRRVERRGEDPLVLRDQVVGELVEVADPADHRRRGDDLVAVRGQFVISPTSLASPSTKR